MKEFFAKTFTNAAYNVDVKGKEKLNFTDKTIIVPNHGSALDPAVLAFNLPKEVVFVAHPKATENFPFIKNFRRIITVEHSNPYSIREMIKVVNEGTPIVIFPEGRISTTGGLMKMYEGIGYIALKTGAKIYPIGISGTERTKFSYLNDKNDTKLFSPVSMSIGNPFYVEEQEGLSNKQQTKQAILKIEKAIQNEVLKSKLKEEVNLYNELYNMVQKFGANKVILEEYEKSLTYKDLIRGSIVLGNKLEPLLEKNKRVGVYLPNAIGTVVTLFGLAKINKVPAMLNYSMGEQSLIDCCETGELEVILTSHEFIEKGELSHVVDALKKKAKIIYLEDIKDSVTTSDKLHAAVEYTFKKKVSNTNNEVILFTSGSESKPKGVILTHKNFYSNVMQVQSIIDLTDKDRIFNALPMFHSFGLTGGTFLPIFSGLPVFFYPNPLHYKEIPELIYQNNSTVLFGTSTFLEGYGKYAHPYDFHNVRLAIAGAEKLKDEVRYMWLEKFGVRIFEGYGATETTPVLSVNTPLHNKSGTVGKLLPGVDYKLEKVEGINEGGSLLVKGPNIMKGYLIHGKGFVPSTEWYDTGDVVEIDDEGFVSIKSRLKRFAKIAGEMISLNLSEEMAIKCFKDTHFAAVALPDKRKGEKIVLYTTNKNADLKVLKTYIKEQKRSMLLAPAHLEFIEEIPVLGSGKTDYVTLQNKAKQKYPEKQKEGLYEKIKKTFTKGSGK